MNSITKDYLTGIVLKKISATIDKHRESKKQQFDYEPYPGATDEEVLDFILSIPYFDEKLKDFLLGNLAEDTIIISQAWENEFIKKTMLWTESFEWLNTDDSIFTGSNTGNYTRDQSFLTLPY